MKKFLVMAAGTAIVAVGLVSVATGSWLVFRAGPLGETVTRSATGLADGLEGAERVLDVLGADFEGSSTLLGQVSGAVMETAGVLSATGAVLESLDSSAGEMVAFSDGMADDLEGLAAALGPLGQGRLTGPAGRLRLAADAARLLLENLDGLDGRIAALESTLVTVSISVDSLARDLGRTHEAVTRARGDMAGLRRLAASVAEGDAARNAIVLAGLILVFLGAQELIMGVRVSGIRIRRRRTSQGEEPGDR